MAMLDLTPCRNAVAWVAWGGNLSDPLRLMKQVLADWRVTSILTVRFVSQVYESAPVGCDDEQGVYLNGVLGVETSLSPNELLAVLLETETRYGRSRQEGLFNQPRPIDLDLLAYEQQMVSTNALQIPHPRLENRLFVLLPWAEDPLARQWIHPILNVSLQTLVTQKRLELQAQQPITCLGALL
jgi:2-amino-4-hydroxy-6-hydroxymethyldihydropteridine diphosphokinase